MLASHSRPIPLANQHSSCLLNSLVSLMINSFSLRTYLYINYPLRTEKLHRRFGGKLRGTTNNASVNNVFEAQKYLSYKKNRYQVSYCTTLHVVYYCTWGKKNEFIARSPRWLGRLSSCLLKSISRVQFSPSAITSRDFFLHKKMLISGKRKSVSQQHSMKIDEQWEC